MRFGVKLGNVGQLPLEDGVGRLAVATEDAGFDSVWVADHIAIPRSHRLDENHKRGDSLATKQHGEALVSLAYVAGLTKRVQLSTSIMVVPLRNPLTAAKMIATLDVLSGGRVVLGAGVGWLEAEFEALRAPAFANRGRVTDEWIRIFRTCWNDSEPVFKGEHYAFDALHFSPKPVRSIPILIGGNSGPALRRAGALGDGWHGTRVATGDIPNCIRTVKLAAERAGRDPSALTFGLGVEIDIVCHGGSRSAVGLYSPEQALLGTPDEITRSIQEMEAAGISQLELRFRPMRDPANTSIAPTLEMIEQFAKEILPRFRK